MRMYAVPDASVELVSRHALNFCSRNRVPTNSSSLHVDDGKMHEKHLAGNG
jgi:hypothetical protein